MYRFKNILFVVTDDSDMNATLKRAVTLANNHQAQLTVVQVIDDLSSHAPPPITGLSEQELHAQYITVHQQQLAQIVQPYRDNNNIKLVTKILIGTPFIEIIQQVLRHDHDLVIRTAHNDGERFSRIFGSDDINLLRKCPSSVLLINPKSEQCYRRILAAVDVNDNYLPKELDTHRALNSQTLEIASSLAVSEPADLHVVYAWNAPYESFMSGGFLQSSEQEICDYVDSVKNQQQQNMDTLITAVSDKVGAETFSYINIKSHLLKGSPRKIIPTFSTDINADLMIIGTVARTGIPGFIMGNTAETIINNSNCSVLAIKPPGFVCPIKLETDNS